MQQLVEQVYHNPDIFKINVPLTGNALKNLNSYVIVDGGESLIIDTGFHTVECRQALMDGLKELGISPEHTALFGTHLHSDHIGLAQYFNYPDSTIYMGQRESEYYRKMKNGTIQQFKIDIFLKEGFPPEELKEASRSNPATIYLPDGEFEVVGLQDHDKIRVGNVELTALYMPGHTPGQMCLYLEKEHMMFTGDHVLFDITPNITNWPGMENPLGVYLDSLKKLMQYKVKTVFPAHRNLSNKTMEQRIAEIIAHHAARCLEITEVLKSKPGATGYEIAEGLTWSLHGETWDTAPKRQKWFAVGETLAHLEYLMHQERITRKEVEPPYGDERSFYRYYIKE